jgi:hypothetical protein
VKKNREGHEDHEEKLKHFVNIMFFVVVIPGYADFFAGSEAGPHE